MCGPIGYNNERAVSRLPLSFKYTIIYKTTILLDFGHLFTIGGNFPLKHCKITKIGYFTPNNKRILTKKYATSIPFRFRLPEFGLDPAIQACNNLSNRKKRSPL